jgi:hypothetical protein
LFIKELILIVEDRSHILEQNEKIHCKYAEELSFAFPIALNMAGQGRRDRYKVDKFFGMKKRGSLRWSIITRGRRF